MQQDTLRGVFFYTDAIKFICFKCKNMAQKTRLTQQDLKIYPSERLTDTDDGGGLMRGVALTGADNELFDPVSDIDRVMGSLNVRLVYPGVLRDDAEPLYGAHFIISEPPKADNVSYLAFRANNYGDSRAKIMPRIEAYSVPTIESKMTLLGTQLKGTRLVQAYQRVEADIPVVGQRFCLRDRAGNTQYIRIADIEHQVRTFERNDGTEFQRRVLKIEISDALTRDFAGIAYPVTGYGNADTKILETQVADTASYYGVKPLAEAIAKGVGSLKVPSIYEKLVPTGVVETAFADQFPTGATAWLPLEARRRVAYISGSYSGNVYFDCSVQPGTVEFGAYVDNAQGQLVNGNSVIAVDYAQGVLQNVSGYNIDVYAVPAARVNNADYTTIVSVDETNQGTEWAPLLTPKPAPGATAISFMSGGEWYTVKDYGDYKLRDASGKVIGSIERSGSVVVSLPALPDVDSKIVFAWSPIDTFSTVDDKDIGSSITLPPVEAQTRLSDDNLKNAKPGSVQIRWTDGSTQKSAHDENGKIVGDITGTIDYASGTLTLSGASATEYQATAKAYIASRQRKTVAVSGGDTDMVSGSFGGEIAPGSAIIEIGAVFGVDKSAGKTWTENPSFGGNYIGFREANSSESSSTINRYVHAIYDDGIGGLWSFGKQLPGATINYTTGTFTIPTAALARDGRKVVYSDNEILNKATPISVPTVSRSNSGSLGGSAGTSSSVTYYARVDMAAMTAIGGTATRDVSATLTNDRYTINILQNKPWPSRAVFNSWVILMNGKRLIERDGVFYRDIDAKTGNGTPVGTMNPQTGEVVLGEADLANRQITVLSGVYRTDDFAQKQYYGRTPAAPVKPQSFTVYSMAGNETKVGRSQANEAITGDFSGSIDTETGFFMLNAAGFFAPETLRFNVVTQSYLPLDSSIIGIDAVRLPPDGKVPIFRKGDMIVISNKESTELGSAFTANQTVSLGRDDIDRAAIVDAAGVHVDAEKYDIDTANGTLTWKDPLDLSEYTMPLTAHTMREESNRIIGVDIAGNLKLQMAVSRAYERENTYVSSALIAGDLLVRATAPFAMQSWGKKWLDEPDSDAILAKLNVKDFPFQLTSAGAITERWLIRFESDSQFLLYGETLGLVVRSDTLSDLSPTNPATGKPYFTLPRQAFGGGWASGNCVRFNTFGTPTPIWILRSVQPSPNQQHEKDGFTGCLRGNTIDI